MRRPIINTTVSNQSKAIINRASAKYNGKISKGIDDICQKYEENRDVIEDPDAINVARAYISERNKRLIQSTGQLKFT